ncbi:hypothetical protein H1C71_038859, partial [Ictidomys tridecemlineatus]
DWGPAPGRRNQCQLGRAAAGVCGLDWTGALWVEQVDLIVQGRPIWGERSWSDGGQVAAGDLARLGVDLAWGLTWMALGCWRDSVYLLWPLPATWPGPQHSV